MIKYYDIDPEVIAFSTTREGGNSKGNYSEFNINEYCGDDMAAVQKNRLLLSDELGIKVDHLIIPHQTHGIELRQIGNEFFTLPEQIRRMLIDGVDGILTSVPDVCIGVSTADCIPVLLYDTEYKAACAVHAGWRGTMARIVQKAVVEMQNTFHAKPASLKACIGPGISLEHFEVGEEVYNAFCEAGFEMEKIAEKLDKWHINLSRCNEIQLEQMGLVPDNISVCGVCTYTHADEYFSARRLGIASGRIFSGIMVRRSSNKSKK